MKVYSFAVLGRHQRPREVSPEPLGHSDPEPSRSTASIKREMGADIWYSWVPGVALEDAERGRRDAIAVQFSGPSSPPTSTAIRETPVGGYVNSTHGASVGVGEAPQKKRNVDPTCLQSWETDWCLEGELDPQSLRSGCWCPGGFLSPQIREAQGHTRRGTPRASSQCCWLDYSAA